MRVVVQVHSIPVQFQLLLKQRRKTMQSLKDVYGWCVCMNVGDCVCVCDLCVRACVCSYVRMCVRASKAFGMTRTQQM